jgi:hypothetical protein
MYLPLPWMDKKLIDNEIKAYLDEKVLLYNNPNFIESDPISIPHRYDVKEDIEIAGFLAATISWGNRKSIVKNGHRMLDLLGDSPYDFVISHNAGQLKSALKAQICRYYYPGNNHPPILVRQYF